MAPKTNPLKLNALQLRTLAVLQALAAVPGAGTAAPDGGITVARFPSPHGDHFHVGNGVIAGKDATGLFNEKVWHALERKGLASAEWPHRMTLTRAGLAYDTGLAETILQHGAH
jgi:hypothetical protein